MSLYRDRGYKSAAHISQKHILLSALGTAPSKISFKFKRVGPETQSFQYISSKILYLSLGGPPLQNSKSHLACVLRKNHLRAEEIQLVLCRENLLRVKAPTALPSATVANCDIPAAQHRRWRYQRSIGVAATVRSQPFDFLHH